MEISYQIKEDDYLTYQLFVASGIKELSLKRKSRWFFFSVLYSTIAIVLYFFTRQKDMAIILGVLSLLWIIIYPIYTRVLYRNKYRKYIRKNHKEMFNQTVRLKIEEANIKISDSQNKSRVLCEDVKGIYEISHHYFLGLKKGGAIIIPKRAENNGAFVAYLNKNHQTPIIKNLTWKWR